MHKFRRVQLGRGDEFRVLSPEFSPPSLQPAFASNPPTVKQGFLFHYRSSQKVQPGHFPGHLTCFCGRQLTEPFFLKPLRRTHLGCSLFIHVGAQNVNTLYEFDLLRTSPGVEALCTLYLGVGKPDWIARIGYEPRRPQWLLQTHLQL